MRGASACEDLKAAVREPEKWHHLIVRAGGYSDYFWSFSRT